MAIERCKCSWCVGTNSTSATGIANNYQKLLNTAYEYYYQYDYKPQPIIMPADMELALDYSYTAINNKSNNKEDNMSLIEKAKKLTMKKDDKELLKAGITDDCGNLTSDGRDLVIETLFTDNKAKLVEIATKLNAEKKDKK